jgi:hypothetical protein
LTKIEKFNSSNNSQNIFVKPRIKSDDVSSCFFGDAILLKESHTSLVKYWFNSKNTSRTFFVVYFNCKLLEQICQYWLNFDIDSQSIMCEKLILFKAKTILSSTSIKNYWNKFVNIDWILCQTLIPLKDTFHNYFVIKLYWNTRSTFDNIDWVLILSQSNFVHIDPIPKMVRKDIFLLNYVKNSWS